MKMFWRVLRVLVLAYLGVCGVLWLVENSLLYRPSTAQDDWEPVPFADIEDVDLTAADGTRIHTWFLPCPGADGALLYCHGNAGNLSHRGGSIAKLRDLLKVHVLIFDYPGYGKSGGRPTEQGCYLAADAAYAFLTDKRQIQAPKILLYGGSLGGGVAVDLAARKAHRALVLVKTFTSAPDAGANLLPWFPVRWLMRNRFDNMAKIKNCTRPVFIGHGTRDTLIPFTQGKRLFEAANEPKQFFTLEGDNHNDPLPLEFFATLRAFLEKNP
jgi:fermentation-respiration switch protein FrsA (DUF1100 family)